jgi:predicted CXXCH cytochrome family protein
MRSRLHLLALALAVSAGCGKSSSAAPWLTMSDAASHARHFPIAVGDTHGPAAGQATVDCNACHYDKAKAAPSDTFKLFTCTNCHGVTLKSGVLHDGTLASFSTWHNASGVTGTNGFDATVAAANTLGYFSSVAPLDAACHHCHPSGIGVDHATRFILPHQNAAATVVATCTDCHVVPGDRKQLGCSACHPHDTAASDTAHATLVPGYLRTNAVAADVQASSLLCARCHEDGKIPVRVAAHATSANGFIVGTGKHSGPTGGACLSCHDQNKTTAPRTFVADFKATNCVGCHDVVVGVSGTTNALHGDQATLALLHTSVTDFASTITAKGSLSAACLFCHSDGAGGAPSNHELLFPRLAGTKHAGLSCAQCHGSGAKNIIANQQCVACHVTGPLPPPLTAALFNTAHAAPLNHTSTGQNSFTLLDMTSPATCIRCHAPSTINPASALVPITQAAHSKGESGNNTGKHKNVGCLDCHGGLRTVGGPTPPTYQAGDFTQRSCLTCHSSNNPG